MDTPFDHQHAQIIKSGALPRGGGAYDVVVQSAAHIDHMVALENAVRGALPPKDANFLHPRDRDFFEKHLADGHLVLGIVHGGRLVAQCLLVLPGAQAQIGDMKDMRLKLKPEKTAALEGILVHPSCRGNALMSVLVEAHFELARKHGRTDVVAETAVGNRHSWSVLLREGMSIRSVGHVPEENVTLYTLHAPLKRPKAAFNKAAAKKTVHVPANDVSAQQALLSQGHRGVAFDAAMGTIAFRKPLMPRRA